MKRIKIQNLEPGMVVYGYPGVEFSEPLTVTSVRKINGGYEVWMTGAAYSTTVPEGWVYLVKEEDDPDDV